MSPSALYLLAVLVAASLFSVITTRCICVIYHAYWDTHPKGQAAYILFGMSYILLALSAGCFLAYVVTGEVPFSEAGVWAGGLASAGMILTDRRLARGECLHAPRTIS